MSVTIDGLLEASLRFGAGKVDVVCLRNREGGDGQGGSASYFLIEATEKGTARTIKSHVSAKGIHGNASFCSDFLALIGRCRATSR